VTWSCRELGHELGDATRLSVKEEVQEGAVRCDPWTRGDELLTKGTVGGFPGLTGLGFAGWRRAARGSIFLHGESMY
jgi:hypothetical protein